MRFLFKTFIILFLSGLTNLFSQIQFNFDFDYARFKYDSVQSYVEFYYSFPQNELTLIKDGNRNSVRAVLQIEIRESNTDSLVIDKKWEVNSVIADISTEALNKNLIGVLGFGLPKGTYNCIVTGMDGVNDRKRKSINETLVILPFEGDNVSISDIQAASNIIQGSTDTASIFYKNTLEVIPNPVMVYGEGLPVLFYYAEVYNLKSSEADNNIKIKTYLINSKGVTVLEKFKEISRAADSRVEVGTIKINKLPTDSYSLVVGVIDSMKNYGVSSSKKIYVYNPSIVDSVERNLPNASMLGSEYSVMNNDDCDDLFEKSKFVASSQEISQYNNIKNLDGKREFLFQFWKKRDKDPSTTENEYKNEIMERIRVSNERFSSMGKKGMKTDRGRIFIEFGNPDEIDRYPNETNSKPYEIWQYHQIEGGVIFIFGDLTGFSDYQLIHSTKRGELRDDNWQQRIIQN